MPDPIGTPDSIETPDTIEPPDPVQAAEKARTIALRQLEVRDRSRRELADTLRRRGVDDEVAAEVLDSLTRVRLIDDARFAEAWVDSRRRTKGLSRRALSVELARKGIATDEAGAALGEIDEQSEQELADRFASRRAATLAKLPRDVALRRLAGQLARKGHAPSTAFRAATTALGDPAELTD